MLIAPTYNYIRLASRLRPRWFALSRWRKVIRGIDRSRAVDGFVFLLYKGKPLYDGSGGGRREEEEGGLENPCLLTSLWNWLGPLWRVDELLYLSLSFSLSLFPSVSALKTSLSQLYFRTVRSFAYMCAHALYAACSRARFSWRCLLQNAISPAPFIAHECVRNGGIRNRRLYLTHWNRFP